MTNSSHRQTITHICVIFSHGHLATSGVDVRRILVVTAFDHSVKSLTLIGKFLRPFYWKTHPLKIMGTYSVFFQFRGVILTVLLENSSRPNVTYHVYGFSQKIRLDEFSSTYPWFSMDEFSSETACVMPQNWNFQKTIGWLFQ